jgi:hypothetical protein
MIEMTGAILAVGTPPPVEEFAITVAAAAVFGYLAQRVGLVSIVGFLAAGVLIGPNALGWIDDPVLVEQMGEIGVIFLMFFNRLELSGEMLKKMGSLLFGGGAVQVGLTIALVTAIGCRVRGQHHVGDLYRLPRRPEFNSGGLEDVVEPRRDEHADRRGRGGVAHLPGHRRGDPRVVGAQAR